MQPGDRVPHFEVTDVGGHPVRYATIWQAQPLVLLCLPPGISAAADDYVARLTALLADLDDAVACVITRDSIAGIGAPAVVIADQWGEVVHTATATRPEGLPDATVVQDWVQFLLIRCPECEGEVR